MIRGGEVLLAMAQIAIGLAGFSGVVAAFSRTRDFPAPDRVRFLMLVGGTFFVILLAFVPFLLELGGMEEPGLWRWSSGIWLAGLLACAPLIVAGRRVILREGRPAPAWSLLIVLMIGAGAALAQGGNVVGWPYSPGVVPYLLGLLAGLIGSGSIFVYLVLIRPHQGV
ncbi:MAG: hypothetical protein Q8W51_11530 [Candidatus Palauibacterales bacterium]|nr:hypothetical protein [Candidatus Palauibacterales bacterium]MDP2584937.1 hypothetical protein [Candidatus Palauibacterales bacterium]